MRETARERFMHSVTDAYDAALDILIQKNDDYATEDDPFHNFKAVLEDGLTVGQGMSVRMRDKMARIGNLTNKPPSVKDESLRDTLIDMMNYSALYIAWLDWNEE